MKFEIEVTEQQVIEAIGASLVVAEYDEDGERTTRGLDVLEVAKRVVRERADAAVAAALSGGLQEVMRERIAAALEEGFQPVNAWGSHDGARMTLKSAVAKALTEKKPNYHGKSVHDWVVEFAKQETERQVREMVQAARAKIEQSLADAAGEALKSYMRKHAGL